LATENKRIFHIVDTLANTPITQVSVAPTADSVLGYRPWGGVDATGHATAWLAKDETASISSLILSGGSTTGAAGLLKHDTGGVVTGGLITVAQFNSYLSDGPLTAALTAEQIGYGSVSNLLTGKSTFVFDPTNNYLGINNSSPACGIDINSASPDHVSGDSRNANFSNIECSNAYVKSNIRLPNETYGTILFLNSSTPGMMVSSVGNFNYKITDSMYRTINAAGAARTDIISNGSTSGEIDIASFGVTSTSKAYLRSEGTTVSTLTQATATSTTGTAQVLLRAKRTSPSLAQSILDLQHGQASFTSTGNMTMSTSQSLQDGTIDILATNAGATYGSHITIHAEKTVGTSVSGQSVIDIISDSLGGEGGPNSVVNIIAHSNASLDQTHEVNLNCRVNTTDYEISVQEALVNFNNIATVDFNSAKLADIKNAAWGEPTTATYDTSTITVNFSTGKDFQDVNLTGDATTLTLTAPTGGAAKGLVIRMYASAGDRDVGGGAGFNGVNWDEGVDLAIISKTIPSGKYGIISLVYDDSNWFGSMVVFT